VRTGEQGLIVRAHSDGIWTRFGAANKRFCKRQLQPRLFPVGHLTAIDSWFCRQVQHSASNGELLEFGCGRAFRLTHLLADRFATRCATDIVDLRPGDIPPGVIFKTCGSAEIPFADGQFDAVVIASVIEHLERPQRTLAEMARVTKPGGVVLMNLPNKWDYVSVAARASGRFKSSILKKVVQAQWEDFPVRYRCNTKRSITRGAAAAGLIVEELLPVPAQPSYLTFFVPLYMAAAIYQFTISILGLDVLQPAFVVSLRKPAR
jgi:SAM-dependent methyltransferase